MREFDDAGLELQLRGVLKGQLGTLPLDLTVEALERRRAVRETAVRRRRRGLVVLGLAAALLIPLGVMTGGGRSLLEGFVAPGPSVAPEPSAVVDASFAQSSPTPSAAVPSVTPAPSGTPAPTPTVIDPHALIVLTSKAVFTEGTPSCVNMDRFGTRDRSSQRLVACGDRVAVTGDGTSAAVGGPQGLSIVDTRDGHELAAIDTGGRAFPTVWSPSGRWLVWSSCPSARSEPCSVILSARDGSGQHVLYHGNDGYASPKWLPDESRVALAIGGALADIRVGAGDGSDFRGLLPDGSEAGWAGGVGFDDRPTDFGPGGRSYLSIATKIPAGCDGQSVTLCKPILSDVISQGLSDGADDGAPVNLTNLAPGQFAVAAAWSPDGGTLAVLRKTIDPDVDAYEQQGRLLGTPAELWLRDASGTFRRIDGVVLPEPLDGYVEHWAGRIHWSPDGTRLAIEAGNVRTTDVASIDTYVVAVDGSAPIVLRDARSVAWSPDGTELAFAHWSGPLPADPVPASEATIEVIGADGADRRQIVVPSGDLDGIHFVWAAN